MGVAALVGAALALTGCEKKKEFEPPDRERQVALAGAEYSPALFDSLAWDGPDERATAGAGVWASHCRSCHGTLGRGDTDYAREQGLEVPSLVRADWPYDSLDAVRRRIYTGHPAGMPTWGVAGISPREIDAVAYYLADVLRSEMAGDTAAP